MDGVDIDGQQAAVEVAAEDDLAGAERTFGEEGNGLGGVHIIGQRDGGQGGAGDGRCGRYERLL